MQGTKEGIGFRTASAADRVALRGVHLSARLSGMSLRATLEQTFVNLEPHAIEAVYTFPLPEGAAVCGFEVITGDHIFTGTVEELNQGIEQYEQAVSEGHGAFLMEQERPDVFTVRVGNIKPKQAATIRLKYVCPLERVDKSIRVSFPTTLAPRFVAGSDPIEAAIDGDALNPPHVLCVPYGISMEVDVALGRQVTSARSPSHAISVANGEDGTCRISFAGGIAEMDRDVVLLLDLAREHQPCVQASRGSEGESYLAVTFVPEFDDEALAQPAPAETVFVLDCSGSMQGDSMAQAIAALELCLRSMSVGDTFNVCRFGSSWEMMSSEPLVYSQKTLDRALAYVRDVRDLGGTVLHPALEWILTQPLGAGSVRQVILLTDGQVSNEPEVVELARKNRKTNRIFSFGIGSACSAFLVKGIARATGGAAEFITGGERIDDKVLRTFSRITSPPVTDISIDWDGCDVQTLAEMPPVFDGDVMAVFGRAPTRLPRRVTLSCLTPAGPQKWSVDVPPPLQDDGVIATMWARRTIQSMEEVTGIAGTRSRIADQSKERQMLIQLSKQFGLLCSLTTFVAVEHRSPTERNNGAPALRRVPVKLAAGWGGVDAGTGVAALAAGAAAACVMAAPAPMAPPMRALRRAAPGVAGGLASLAKKAMDAFGGSAGRSITRGFASSAPGGGSNFAPPPPAPLPVDKFPDKLYRSSVPAADETAPSDPLRDLLSLQSAEGWFAGRAVIEAAIQAGGGDPTVWRAAIVAAIPSGKSENAHPQLVQTVMALLLFRQRFASDESLWRRSARKAIRPWLASVLGMKVAAVEAWVEELRKELGM
jgi:Ca-activated chloride channel family protein